MIHNSSFVEFSQFGPLYQMLTNDITFDTCNYIVFRSFVIAFDQHYYHLYSYLTY